MPSQLHERPSCSCGKVQNCSPSCNPKKPKFNTLHKSSNTLVTTHFAIFAAAAPPAAATPSPTPYAAVATVAAPAPPMAALWKVAKRLPAATFPIMLWIPAAIPPVQEQALSQASTPR